MEAMTSANIQRILNHFKPDLAKDEMIELVWSVTDCADDYDLRAMYFKVRPDGLINVHTVRNAVLAFDGGHIHRLASTRGLEGRLLDEIRDGVRYVLSLVMPPKLPRFRIGRRRALSRLRRFPNSC